MSGAGFYIGEWNCGRVGAQTCPCRSPGEMLVLVFLACLSAAAANHTASTTTNAPDSASSTTKELLKASETGDPSKVEIVKQIRRLNEDGSYTIGYEADDGTFKIESRDVQGNVKGTFGYIDRDGEVKRVTYSSSSDSTPAAVPVSTSTTPSPPAMVVRVNKTVSSTTRRPLPTVVYPSRDPARDLTRGSYTTRGTVIQPIPRRRGASRTTDATTERQRAEETTTNIQNLYRPKEDDVMKMRTQMLKPMSGVNKDDLVTKQTTTKVPVTFKPSYERATEKTPENKANTFRRELTSTSHNPHMISLRQSTGDDSSDVYGSHLSLGTVRPLFTTTTPRPRLVPIQSLVAARQRIHQQYQEQPIDDQETTIEASTGRVFDHQSEVTSNPVPVIHIPAPRDPRERDDDLYHQQPIYRRPPASAQFRTHEYLRDNPGAPVPIGNQRPFLQYEYQNKVLDQQFLKENQPPQKPETATPAQYDVRPVTRIIPVPVDERGVPIQGYQRFVNAYRQPQQHPPQPLLFHPRYENPVEEMQQISAPVSTRDLRRLLQILILRQNKLQSLMDQVMPGPYQPLYRPEEYRYQQPRHYQDEYDYRDRYDPREMYNQYENQYESQRYIPRRRLYQRPYDTAGSSSNRIEESPEFLPAEIREALLLKMLILAINPDFLPTQSPPTELTTAAPPRKQVRNVQILGEEGSMDEKRQRH